MGTITGKGGRLLMNGKEYALADFSFDEAIVPTVDEERAPFPVPKVEEWTGTFTGTFNRSGFWQFWLLSCKVTISRYGFDFTFEGMINEEKTRLFLESSVTPGKYFLKHLEDNGKTLRHERITHDVDEAGRWVLGD